MYDVIHFEALGEEWQHLEMEVEIAIQEGRLPNGFSQLITQQTLQQFIDENPSHPLPRLITIKTHSIIPREWIDSSPIGGVVTRSAGYDHLESLASRAHIASLREYCVQAVAQTALKLLLAAAGRLNDYTTLTDRFDRKSAPSFMELCKERRAAVFGVGRIGRAIHDLLRSVGLDVVGVDIRQKELSALYGPSVTFLPPREAMESADIVINGMNLTRDPQSPFHNLGYFSDQFLDLATRPIIFINVTRGEIAPEEVLLKRYNQGKIIGIGLDVFSEETGLAVLLAADKRDDRHAASRELIRRAMRREGNIYVQPHQGFNSDRAARQKALETVRHLEAWFRNDCRRFDDELPYY